jgi:hypothetical protein
MEYLKTDALNRIVFLAYKVGIITSAEELKRRKEAPDEAIVKREKPQGDDSF